MGPNQSAATRLTRRRRTIRGRPSIRRARALAGKARPRREGGGPEGRRAAPAAPASAVHCGHGARTPPGTGRRERRPVAPGRRRQIRALRVVGGSAFRRPLVASPRSAARRAGPEFRPRSSEFAAGYGSRSTLSTGARRGDPAVAPPWTRRAPSPVVARPACYAVSDENGRISFKARVAGQPVPAAPGATPGPTSRQGETMPFDHDTWRDQWLGGF